MIERIANAIRSFTTNYTSRLHSQSVQSFIGILRIGTFVAVVIETLEAQGDLRE